MKKRFLTLLLASVMLVACGKQETKKEEVKQTEQKQQPTQKVEEKKEEPKLDIDDPKSEEPDKDFRDKQNSGIAFKRMIRKNVTITSENKNLKITCKKIALGKFKITDKYLLNDANIFLNNFKLKLNEEYSYCSMPLDIENIGDKDVELDVKQTLASLNTKEQINANNIFTDDTNPTILKEAKAEKHIFFIIKNSKIEEINEIKLKFPMFYVNGIGQNNSEIEMILKVK